MKLEHRSLLIAGTAGGLAKLFLGFIGTLFSSRPADTPFGASQQHAVASLLGVVTLGIFGLVVSTAIGAFYVWLARQESFSVRELMAGGALSAALATLAGSGLVAGIVMLPSLRSGGNLLAELAVFVAYLIFVVALGAVFGALGAWICRRSLASA